MPDPETGDNGPYPGNGILVEEQSQSGKVATDLYRNAPRDS